MGNSRSTFVTLGASNHTDRPRQEHDYYATEPVAIDMLEQTGFFDKSMQRIWEPACGGGHLAQAMQDKGYEVYATDLYDRGYKNQDAYNVDFLNSNFIPPESIDAIVTNPPYKYAQEFIEKALRLGVNKVAMFLKLTFLEGQRRQALFKATPPHYVAVCVNRVQCAYNGDPEMFKQSSAACYAWFIWEQGYQGNPEILWIEKPKTA